MGRRDLLFIAVVLGGAAALGAGIGRAPDRARPVRADAADGPRDDLGPVVAEVDAVFRRRWDEKGLKPTPRTADLAVLRRLSLALTGTIPSLEETRRFEALPAEGRVETWLDDVLRDRRSADYLADRLARAFVGTEDGPFIVFRRRRFVTWLGDALAANRPYDAIVRDLIAGNGVWTDHPETNFETVTFNPETGRPDPERLAARVARAFLGVRLDCAQCHNHPFQPWKQADFRGLAAFFGALHSDLRGVRDTQPDYHPPDRKSKQPTTVEPRVPFRPELLPASGKPRERLAAWVVDPRNPTLARATVNRVWALLLGRPLVEPIDDLPAAGEVHPALQVLADDFASHGHDLRRLIRVIAATTPFRIDSATESDGDGPTAEQEEAWASFPLTRLRPEQVAGAVLQAASLTTLDGRSFWFFRLAAYNGRNEFVGRYGDTGEDEFDARAGTIPQRLLLMNGTLVREKTKDDLANATTRIAILAPDDAKAVEVAYLTVLTRRPTPAESAHFVSKLDGTRGNTRKERLTDLFWTLLNATEASWNH
ncbi:MAG TPA: DUF1549 domain-containing protein [Isosphaeraceae bacterium]|jgi:hypothetical protein|nr:DUF1549 domain-containing protein [Isosphaeraceae bacterium]